MEDVAFRMQWGVLRLLRRCSLALAIAGLIMTLAIIPLIVVGYTYSHLGVDDQYFDVARNALVTLLAVCVWGGPVLSLFAALGGGVGRVVGLATLGFIAIFFIQQAISNSLASGG